MSEKFLTATDVAWKLNMNLRTVQRLLKLGKIPGFRAGGEWRIAEEELTRWMNEQRPVQTRDVDYVY
jgi:excisionase family DNA binding protein